MIHVFWEGVMTGACSVCIKQDFSLLVPLQLLIFLCTRFEVMKSKSGHHTVWYMAINVWTNILSHMLCEDAGGFSHT
jgi:hypothetical protein